MQEFLDIVKARYSCRNFKDSTMDAKVLENILEAGRLAPSSLGLEPWRFYVVQDSTKKQEISNIANNQSHVAHCGAIIIITARLDFAEYFEARLKARNLSEKERQKRIDLYKPFLENMSAERKLFYAREQTHLAIANMANAASAYGIASCIIGGFDNKKLDAYLELDASEKTSLILVVGEPLERIIKKKVRTPKEEVIKFI